MTPTEVNPAPPDDRDARALPAGENADLCSGCVKCCTYIAIEIDSPRQAWEYDQWIWMLHHRNIHLYVETPERWYIHVDTVCEQLDDRGRCGIYGRHPVLCREYDPRSCERRLPLADIRAWFSDAYAFEAWIRTHRPAHWKRLMAHRRDSPDAPPLPGARPSTRAAMGLIPLAALLAPSRAHATPGTAATRSGAVLRRKAARAPAVGRTSGRVPRGRGAAGLTPRRTRASIPRSG